MELNALTLMCTWCIQTACFSGEKVYLGHYFPSLQVHRQNMNTSLVYGVVTPSQQVISYFECNGREEEVTLNTSKEYLLLTCKDSLAFFWVSSDEDLNHFLTNIIVTYQVTRNGEKVVVFPARVEASVIKESKVVGYYDKSKFPADLDGPLVGVGQAWYDENVQQHIAIKNFEVLVPYDGAIFKVNQFQVLWFCTIPKLSHITYPTINWVTVSDGDLPPNAVASGVAPNGKVLYVGRGLHGYDMIPGYIVPFEKCLHICYDCGEYCYNRYEVLTIEERDGLEWSVYSNGEVPPNAVAGNSKHDRLFIGRTVTGSDISAAATWQKIAINLPSDRVASTQLLGKIHCSHRCLYVPWSGKEFIYPSYEVLKLKMRPKNLKDLCCNVIITATMGMSHIINRLPLPENIKRMLKEMSQLK